MFIFDLFILILGATSTIDPLITSNQPTPISAPIDPPTSGPTLVPSSGESRAETDRRQIISVDAVREP